MVVPERYLNKPCTILRPTDRDVCRLVLRKIRGIQIGTSNPIVEVGRALRVHANAGLEAGPRQGITRGRDVSPAGGEGVPPHPLPGEAASEVETSLKQRMARECNPPGWRTASQVHELASRRAPVNATLGLSARPGEALS